MIVIVLLLALGWGWIANGLLDNFAADFEELSGWRQIALAAVLVIFAPIFFAEELLEILIDEIIGE